MTDTPKYAEKSVHRTFINAPVETVWSILVATDKPLPFFFGSICDTKDGLKPGARMRMVHPNRKIAKRACIGFSYAKRVRVDRVRGAFFEEHLGVFHV